MIAEVFLDLIGLEFSEILIRSSSAIHDGKGNWSSSAFADVGNHGAPNRKSPRHRVNFSARGSVTILGGNAFGGNERRSVDLTATDTDGFARLRILQQNMINVSDRSSTP